MKDLIRQAILKKIDQDKVLVDDNEQSIMFEDKGFTFAITYSPKIIALEAIRPMGKAQLPKTEQVFDRLNGLNETTFFEKYFVSKEGFFTMTLNYAPCGEDIESQIAMMIEYAKTQSLASYEKLIAM